MSEVNDPGDPVPAEPAGTGQGPTGSTPSPAPASSATDPDSVAEPMVSEEAADAAESEEPVSGADGGEVPLTVEDLVASLEHVSSERDGYLDALRRLQAEFENYRKAVAKRESDARERANEALIAELLPVLDACDGAVANGSEDVARIQSTLVDVLAKQGLARVEENGATFDPEVHEAVMHEEGNGDGPVVAEVLRVGYQWKGRTIRAAMVRVRS